MSRRTQPTIFKEAGRNGPFRMGLFFNPFWLPFLFLGHARVQGSQFIVQWRQLKVWFCHFSTDVNVFLQIQMLSESEGRYRRLNFCCPDVNNVVYFLNKVFLLPTISICCCVHRTMDSKTKSIQKAQVHILLFSFYFLQNVKS